MTIVKLSLLILVMFISSCTRQIKQPVIQPLEKLRSDISDLVSDPNLFNAQVGLYVESLANSEVIYRLNEHKLFISASNMKLYTTSVALMKFGPKFRYTTGFYLTDSLTSGTLNGDLIIRGSGDVSVAERFHENGVSNLLDSWADSLKNMGVSHIKGRVVGDASYFQTNPLGAGWEWDDEPEWYAAQISALTINDNCIDVTVTPNSTIGLPPLVSLSPQTGYFRIDNRAETVPADSVMTLRVTRPRMENTVVLTREMPVNRREVNESVSVEDPAQFFVELFTEALRRKGIVVDAEPRVNREAGAVKYRNLYPVFEYVSPDLAKIITAVNKPSQNLYAEQLLVTLAAEFGRSPSSYEGTRVVTDYLGQIGIPESEFRMQDGSGLSRKNLITPLGTASLLRHISRHDYADFFKTSLPIGGVDGTLERRMTGTLAVNHVRAKTGFVSYARNLSGYVTTRDGEEFVFSVLVNNYTVPTSAINLLQDRICNLLSEFSRN